MRLAWICEASSAIPASMLLRPSITSTAFAEKVAGADPEGPPRHFWRPAVTASRPSSSAAKALPARLAVTSV